MAKQTFTTGQVLTAAQMTDLQATALGGGAPNTKTANYVLVAADAGTTVAMNAAGATTITVDSGLFSPGDTVFIQNIGAGLCTITAGTATVDTAGSLILPQYDAGILYFTSTGVAIFYDYIQVGAASPLTTKGDLYTFSTSDTRLGVGADGTVLTAASGEATGLEWAAPASAGWTQISTTATTSGTSITISSIPTTYTNLMAQFTGVGFAVAAVLQLRLYNNNNTYISGVSGSTAFTSGASGYLVPMNTLSTTSGHIGSITFTNYATNNIGIYGGMKVGSTSSGFGGADSGGGVGGFTSLVVRSTAGTSNFNAGSVILWGI